MSGKMVTEGKSVAFVCLGDATDPNYSSGTPYGIRKGFLDLGCKVIDVFPVRPKIEQVFLPKRVAHRLGGTHYSADREPLCLRAMAATIERRLNSSGAVSVTGTASADGKVASNPSMGLDAPPGGKPTDPSTTPNAKSVDHARHLIEQARKEEGR